MANDRLRVLIMGACGTAGRSFAKAFAGPGIELILSDLDGPLLSRLSVATGAPALFCDVASKSSVHVFAAEVLRRWPDIDVLINAAGAGYERTLGMHNVSRALMPALREGKSAKWIVNVPPPPTHQESQIFRYASSEDAFTRLSQAIAQEVHGSNITVGIACASIQTLEYVDRWSAPPCPECGAGDLQALATNVAELILSSQLPQAGRGRAG